MTQIPPFRLWIGHAGDGENFRQLFDAGIRAVVQLAAEEACLQTPRELIHLRFPLLDGEGNDRRIVNLAVNTLAHLIEIGVPTLVCCSGGVSRSPAIVAAALAATRHEPLDECLKHVRQHHPCDVSPGLWKEIKESSSAKCQ